MDYESTSLWRKTLGIEGDQNVERLRTSYKAFREGMKGLLLEVQKDFPNLTDHSVEHIDNLWKIASLITGENYMINPLEGFILGCSFLVHDSMLSYEAYGGKDELRGTTTWNDNYQDIIGTEYDNEDGKRKIDFKVIRFLHAQNCGDIIFRQFRSMEGINTYLLADDEMRTQFGSLIGEIASSHHWEIEQLQDLPSQVNGLAKFPAEWIIRPRKLACILRCADAAAIDSGRTPDYLFRLLRINGISRDYWMAQNRLGIALDVNDSSRLVITSTHDFEEKDFSAWNIAYDAIMVIAEELDKCQDILAEQEKFQVKSVAGTKSRKELSSLVKTRGWFPSDVSVHISDVAHLIMTLGGTELYGNEDLHLIVLRELIQNARDAIHARRLLEKSASFEGKIVVNVYKSGDDVVLSVTDDGVGMSLDTITHSLLNFGNSFWREDAVNVEFPGLKSAGFKSVGRFGIGFFSSFMIAKSINIETRKYTEGLNSAHLVKFPSGLTLAPIFANYKSSSLLYSTVVSLILGDDYNKWPVEYEVKSNKAGATNFNVPFFAMLGALVAGLDVDVYYIEFDKKEICVHHRIDDSNLDKKLWLRTLSFADYQKKRDLDAYIEANFERLQYITDDNNRFAGLAAIGTRFLPIDDFLGGATVGGLLAAFHSRTGEHWIGILEKMPNGAKRGGGEFKASHDVLENWVNKQLSELESAMHKDISVRFRLQLAMNFFKIDPIKIVVVSCIRKNENIMFSTLSLEDLVKELSTGKKLIFVDSFFGTENDNEGHGDVYLDFMIVGAMLSDNEILYNPIVNSNFLTYKLKNGIPEENYGFIDCLYRKANAMGYKLGLSYRRNYVRNSLGFADRALVIEVL